MEAKASSKKKKLIIGAIIILLAASALITFMVLKTNKGYRVIQLYQLQGTVTIDRPETGTMDAYENLILQSGDGLSVAKKSSSRLKLDEDKYMLVEPESQVKVVAMGDKENAKTDIELEQGAVTVEIQNKLTKNSHYRITTPNAVMAVRGTVFRINVTLDKAGKPVTKISLFEGSVEVQKINEDGSLSDTTVMKPGKEAIVYYKNKDNTIEISDHINYKELPSKSLEFLLQVAEKDRPLPVSQEDIKEMIKDKKQEEAKAEKEERENTKPTGESTTPEKPAGSTPQTPTAAIPDYNQGTQPTSPAPKPTQPTTEPEKYYTVTFKYEGSVFGAQKVKAGERAERPKLKPGKSGSWDYNFSTPITKDTVIHFQ